MLLAATDGCLARLPTLGSISVNNGGTLAVEAGANPGEFKSSDLDSVWQNATFAPGTSFGVQVVSPQTFTYGTSISGVQGLVKARRRHAGPGGQ